MPTAKWPVARKGDSQRISPSQRRRKAQIPCGIANPEADTCLWPACQDPLRLRGIKQRACRPWIFALASWISQTVSWRWQNYDKLTHFSRYVRFSVFFQFSNQVKFYSRLCYLLKKVLRPLLFKRLLYIRSQGRSPFCINNKFCNLRFEN